MLKNDHIMSKDRNFCIKLSECFSTMLEISALLSVQKKL